MRSAFLLSCFALLLAVPAGAQDADRDRVTALAMEAHLKAGDALREKAAIDGALAEYRKALELHAALRAAPAAIPGRAARRADARLPDGWDAADAIVAGLKWLAAHQDEDGKWDCDGFMRHDPAEDKCDGAGGSLYDVGVTSLALLAFLGAGYTDRGNESENPYGKTVRLAIRYLMTVQAEDGVFGPRASQHYVYNHALATLAMCDAYWMTRNPRYKKPAQDALNYIAMARNPYMAWRYEPRSGENDTSVTALCTMALKSGKFGGLEVDPDAFEGARQWIEKMTDPDTGRTGYHMRGGMPARPQAQIDAFPAQHSEAMTAAGILTRIFTGEDPRSSATVRMGADLCAAKPPRWEEGKVDMYYWYCGTLAMFQVVGAHGRGWRDHLRVAVGSSQNSEGARAGSWDPAGAWGIDGGRVYATALMTMCLEVEYRYDRVVGVLPDDRRGR